jgi:uncharacterized CHY-type Zn-finger protein
VIDVAGVELDPQTRCAHYHSALDIVAIKMKCCGLFYACKDCHDALADHPIVVWPSSQWHTQAVLCGACQTALSIAEYIDGSNRCPTCEAPFNPGCRDHHHFYFAQSVR